MDDCLEVKESNARFYEALSTQNLPQMEAVWLHEPWTKCVHPGWEILVGWEKIRESWDNIFRNTEYLKISVTNVSIQIEKDVAWVVCTENIASAREADYQTATAQATNIYYKVNDQWFLVHHHASPATVNAPVEAPESIQ
jgi:ketosteroid isomerase-like protein